MRHFLSILSLLTAILVLAPTAAEAQALGSSCANPIPVDSNYSAIVPAPGTYWYTAWTHDLPLAVNFAPAAGAGVTMPDVEIDFTCTPGVYDDSIMTELFSPGSGTYIAMPQHLTYDYIPAEGVYHLSIGTSYREMMGMMGLLSDVQAYVKVTFPSTGNVYMVPDTLYRDCLTNSQHVALGDTLLITPNDSDRVYILPYSEWKNDSIRYVWKCGSNAKPMTIWIAGTDCHYNLTTGDVKVWDYYELNPGATYKMSADEVASTVQGFQDAGGIFYARIQTEGAGLLIVEKVPEREVDPSAKLLQYDKALNLTEADSSKLYYITESAWRDASSFLTSASAPFRMVISTSTAYATSASDPNVVAAYSSVRNYPGQVVNLTKAEMNALWSSGKDKFLYVRFYPSAPATITPTKWLVSECVENTKLLSFGSAISLSANDPSVFRVRYADIERGTLTLKWTGNSTCPTYFASTCTPAEWNYNASNPTAYAGIIGYKSIARRGSATIDSATVASFSTHIDSEGMLYIRFKPSNAGSLTVTLTREELPDPEPLPCPDLQTISADTTVCDTLLPYNWRGHLFSAAGTLRDTIQSPRGCDSIQYVLTLRTTHCVAPVDPEPVPTPEMGSIALACPSDNAIQISVTEDQWLTLTDQYGNEIASWLQKTSDAPRTFSVVCGVEYRLQGKANTIRIMR